MFALFAHQQQDMTVPWSGWLLRETAATQQAVKALVGAQRIPPPRAGQKHKEDIADSTCPLQPFERGVVIPQSRADQRKGARGHETALRNLFHRREDLLRFGAAACSRKHHTLER